jgi:hypothetical protein
VPVERTTVVPLKRAVDRTDHVVTGTMTARDGTRLAMPKVGDEVVLEFDAPEPIRGMERTVFFDAYGYYLTHLAADGAEQTRLIEDILKNDGRIVDFTMERYMAWRAGTLANN